MKYRAEIDGLRALAVVPVILFHAGFDLFNGGFVGVDVFFVVSGYLITTIIIEDIENKRFSIVNFYERRARRILPALFFVMLVCIPFAWMWMLPNQMKDFSQSLVAVSLFASNILFWRESGYFDAAAEEMPLLHTWSLAVEEQYYVLFPIFLILAWRFGKNRVFWMIVVMATISLLLSEWGSRNSAIANFYLAPTRGWELLAGSIAAFIVQKQGVQKNNFLSLLGLAAIIFSIFAYDESTPFPGVYALVPVLGVVLLVLYADKETIVAKVLSTKAFVGIGLISYSAYLWHQPLFAFARIRSVEHPSEVLILSLSLFSLLLAYFSEKFVEKPFRIRSKFSKNVILFSSVLGLIFFISIGFALIKNNQFDSLRFPGKPLLSEIYSDNDSEWAMKVRTDTKGVCETLGLNHLDEEVCFTNSKQPKLLIVGDSKAMALSSAIFAGYFGIPSVLISAHGCPIFPNLTYTPTFKKGWDNNCTEISKRIFSIKKTIPTIDTVIIANAVIRSDDEMSRYFLNGKNISHNESMRMGYGSLIEKMLSEKMKVIFITDVPSLKNDALLCLYRDDLSNNYCNSTEHEVRQARAAYYANIEYLSNLYDFQVIDSLDILCPKGQCISYDKDVLLYFDKTHLTPIGAHKVLSSTFKTLGYKDSN
jgi:peptidoglycan/LPS O-acetylase OafA/YrhL